MMSRVCLPLAALIAGLIGGRGEAIPSNRLAYLNRDDPIYLGQSLPGKLISRWNGESLVGKAAMINLDRLRTDPGQLRIWIGRLNQGQLGEDILYLGRKQPSSAALLDLDADGLIDLVVGDGEQYQTWRWSPEAKGWQARDFPVDLGDPTGRTESGVRWATLGPTQTPAILVRSPAITGAWQWTNGNWVHDPSLFAGLEIDGERVFSLLDGKDTGLRFRDIDMDGQCEALLSNPDRQALFRWLPRERRWMKLAFAMPQDAFIVGPDGRDAGLRFADLDQDGDEDLVVSNEKAYGVHLFANMETGWTQASRTSGREAGDFIPVLSGRRTAVWTAQQALWFQDELYPSPPQKRSFSYLVAYANYRPLTPPKSFPGNAPVTVSPDANGVLNLSAATAEIRGPSARFEEKNANIGFWRSERDRADWGVSVPGPRSYEVWVEWAAPDGTAGQLFRVQSGENRLEQVASATESWDQFKREKIGVWTLAPGNHYLTVQSAGELDRFLFDLRSVQLVPVADQPN